MRVSFSDNIPEPWTTADRLRAGGAPAKDAKPDAYVLVEPDAGQSRLVLELFAQAVDAHPFRDAIAWQGLILIGFGSLLHVVRLPERSCKTIVLDGYFGSLFVDNDTCLACSASELVRVSADGAEMWRTVGLGADGVLVQDVKDGVILASGQWDPPDADWVDIRLDAATGQRKE